MTDENEKCSRPFDLMGQSVNKKVFVLLKNKMLFSGELKAFDAHFNIWLANAESKNELGEAAQKFEQVLVRGDSVVYVSPA